ncbi:MAG: hypothetical protein ACM3JB_11750 [Acidobacteriaceae bacterium]
MGGAVCQGKVGISRSRRWLANVGTTALSIRPASTPAEFEIARTPFREYQAAIDTDLCFHSFEQELSLAARGIQSTLGFAVYKRRTKS